MFEFEFLFNYPEEPFYVTHDTNHIDNDLLQFLIQLDLDFNNVKQFTVTKL